MVTIPTRLRSLAALAFALGCASACGGEDDGDAEVAVHISGVSKLAGASELVAYVFGSATSCARAKANPIDVQQADKPGDTGCDPDQQALCVIGSWGIAIDGGRGRIAGVSPGLRTIVVHALDSSKAVIGQGCAEGVDVQAKLATPVDIALEPLPAG